MGRYRERDKVWLKANPKEEWKREPAVFIGYQEEGKDVAVIEIPREFRDKDDADGLREITEDQIEGLRDVQVIFDSLDVLNMVIRGGIPGAAIGKSKDDEIVLYTGLRVGVVNGKEVIVKCEPWA